ncbi:MAG TPA: serine/threonine-protein kinase, partial [Gemmatimonadaceae bacterium]|nr:serine/threonine-protein kinase [Gemmatimonadaceae bacterium]
VFYVMSYVEGETLAERVRTRGPVSASDGVRMLREVAWALGYAHGMGVVHRDVKPDNILIEASSGRALVADFGIAAVAGSEDGDGVKGTPEFMSPEQALGKDIDARSDLYGLGATAFYAFAGRPPFEGRSATEVLARQVTEHAAPLASLGLSVPRKLASLVDQCLAKEPNDRPANADVLAEQLGGAIEQRRALPVALRAFVKRNGRMDGGGTLIYSTALLVTSTMLSASINMSAGFAAFAAGVVLAPVAFAVLSARRLLRLGFAHADLGPAFRTELENAREERAVERGGPRILERVLGGVARVALSFTAVSIPVIVIGNALNTWGIARGAFAATMLSLGVGVLTGTTYLALVQSRRDIDTEFWSRLWMGKFGRFAFSLARRLRGSRPVAQAMTHRATELSLSLAAEQLFERLPKATRQELGDLPTLLERLQRSAQMLRTRHEELSSAIEAMARRSETEDVTGLREERDAVHDRLTAAVSALETIRLNLLRLHAGSAVVEGLTTHIGLAEEVSDEIERMVAARAEIDASLRFPRVVEPTPV